MYGRFLKSIRESRGLTQHELATIVGIEQPNLSAYENDRRLPSIDVVNRIAVSCGYLLRVEGAPGEVVMPFPEGGWLPMEGLPDNDPTDPPQTQAARGRQISPEDRVEIVDQVLTHASLARDVR